MKDSVRCFVLLGSVGVIACGSTQEPAVGVDPAPVVARPEPTLTILPVVQVYSPPVYRSFVSRSVAYDAIVKPVQRATLRASLRVREENTFDDDYYFRHGAVTLLGAEGRTVVGFATRLMVDFRYPDPDLIQDGWGTPEFREHHLTLSKPCATVSAKTCKDRYLLKPLGEKRPEFRDPNIAYYRTFGDNDAVLIYFPSVKRTFFATSASTATLGISHPTRTVTQLISRANSIMGRDFVLISPTSLALLRKHAHTESLFAQYGPEVISWVAGMFGAGTYVKALLNVGAQMIEMDRGQMKDAIQGGVLKGFNATGMPQPVSKSLLAAAQLLLVSIPADKVRQVGTAITALIGNNVVQRVGLCFELDVDPTIVWERQPMSDSAHLGRGVIEMAKNTSQADVLALARGVYGEQIQHSKAA